MGFPVEINFNVTRQQDKYTAGKTRLVFGPVPSRRLGLSLGLDLVPPKTCTLDCVYCEVGRTTCHTLERKEWAPAERILEDLALALPDCQDRLDYVTLAGSGEPTLNSALGDIIDGVRKLTSNPVAVLTNGTLLHLEEVRRDLARADLVVPSLDAARPDTFRRINRPAPGLDLDTLIQGLTLFAAEYQGRLWLETLLVRGINDSSEELAAIRDVTARIRPELVQVNTVFRPPADKGVRAVDGPALEAAAQYLGQEARPVGRFHKDEDRAGQGDPRVDILEMVGRRPCTANDLAEALGLEKKRLEELLAALVKDDLARIEKHDQQDFYRRVKRMPRTQVI